MQHKRKTSVPGQYLGYSFQVTRMCHYLLEAKTDCRVSLEAFSDVGVVDGKGHSIAEEVKSRTGTGNPISDRSLEFWKTFRNWVDAIKSGEIDPSTTLFRIHVSKNFKGEIARKFAESKNDIEAGSALAYAKAELLGGTQKAFPKNKLPATLAEHVKAVLEYDSNKLVRIIRSFGLDFGSGDGIEGLRHSIGLKNVSSEQVDAVLNHMLGWIKVKTDQLIKNKKMACISSVEFSQEMLSIVRKLDRQSILVSLAKKPSDKKVKKHLNARTYVRQLDLIDSDDEDKLRAIDDFLRAEADRIDWAARGLVHESSFNELEDDLVGAWKSFKMAVAIRDSRRSEVDRGKLLFGDCYKHTARVQSSESPSHFTRGSFHLLSEKQIIGWHPRFAKLLAALERESGDEGT